jgi:hypothetical protein
MSERIQNVHEKWYKGIKYKSTLEAETAEALDKMGLPIRYEERRLTLIEGFRCLYQKDKVKAITYKPDFWVGNIIIECKGFETPEWKIKKKLVFKYLMEQEPDVIFYQVHDSRKELLKALDNHWAELGCAIHVTSKRDKKNGEYVSKLYDSVKEALADLGMPNKSLGMIMRSLTGKTEYVFGYKWQVKKLKI